jgi:ABC-type sulfate transport system permease subunit
MNTEPRRKFRWYRPQTWPDAIQIIAGGLLIALLAIPLMAVLCWMMAWTIHWVTTWPWPPVKAM